MQWRPEHHVVRDLDEIVDLAALADDRIAQCAAVDGAIGPDLHVVLDDHTADLWHLAVAVGAHDIAESVLPDGAAGVNDHPIADQGMHDCHIGPDRAVAPDAHVRPDGGTRADHCSRPDLGARTDDHTGIDRGAIFDASVRVDECPGCHSAGLEQR